MIEKDKKDTKNRFKKQNKTKGQNTGKNNQEKVKKMYKINVFSAENIQYLQKK